MLANRNSLQGAAASANDHRDLSTGRMRSGSIKYLNQNKSLKSHNIVLKSLEDLSPPPINKTIEVKLPSITTDSADGEDAHKAGIHLFP
jgi:hypothetical protein